MSSSTSATKKMLEEILAEMKSFKSLFQEQSIMVAANREMLNMILAKVSDLGCKVDLDICGLNITKVNNKADKASEKCGADKKPKINIMTYFKNKYKTAPESLNHIISEAEVNKVLEKHATELNSKKKNNLESAKLTLIYKELIKDDKEKSKLLKQLKYSEEVEEDVKNISEITESVIEDELVEQVDSDEDEYKSDD